MALVPTFGNQIAPWMSNNSDTLLNAGIGLLSGRTAPEQVAGLAQGVAGARQKNKTLEFLRQQNPELAQAVESGALSGGDAYKLFYQQKLQAEKPKNNFMSAGGSLYNTETGQWITPPGGASEEQESFYGNPIPIQTPNGIQYGQIGSKGTFKPINIGEGNTFAPNFKTVDTGTEAVMVGPGGTEMGRLQKDLAGAESQKAVGKSEGEALATYRSMSSKMPGLEGVVKKLDGLSEKATYTAGGQILDIGRKQLGLDPREAAIARSEYIATVDNQVLPLLRDTFGAAFTQKEGDTLRATLGDPDKSPQEKQAVLKAFIEQKRRDVEALAVQSRQPQGAPTQGRIRFNPATGELE